MDSHLKVGERLFIMTSSFIKVKGKTEGQFDIPASFAEGNNLNNFKTSGFELL